MENIKVFRIENEEGWGPYNEKMFNIDFVFHEMVVRHSTDDEHPAPSKDFDSNSVFKMMMNNLIFGFNSLEKLKSWFEGYIEYLATKGYNIVEYEIPEENIINSISGLQLMFKK